MSFDALGTDGFFLERYLLLPNTHVFCPELVASVCAMMGCRKGSEYALPDMASKRFWAWREPDSDVSGPHSKFLHDSLGFHNLVI